MEFPIWGESFLISKAGLAIVTVLFVFAAHAASGLGILGAILLGRARREHNDTLWRFLTGNTTAIMLAPFLITVVLLIGTWFYAALVMPAAVSTLIHTFTWIFVIEAVIIIVQAIAAYIYCTYNARLTDDARIIIEWFYAACSWGMVITISAVASFMFTPGEWLTSFNFWDALINPTFIPTAIILTTWALVIGVVIFMAIANLARGYTPDEKGALERAAGRWLWSLAIAFPLAPLYFMAIRRTDLTPAAFAQMTPWIFLGIGIALVVLIAAYFFVALIVRRERIGFTNALLIALLLIAATGAFDLAQVSMRSPFTIAGYLYSNGIFVHDAPRFKREGVLPYAHWIVPRGTDLTRVPSWQRGAWLYEALRYRTYLGKDARRIRGLLKGMNAQQRRDYLTHIDLIFPSIPPFVGNAREHDALVDYIDMIAGGTAR